MNLKHLRLALLAYYVVVSTTISAQLSYADIHNYFSLSTPSDRYDALADIIFGQEASDEDDIILWISKLDSIYLETKDARYHAMSHLLEANKSYYKNIRSKSLESYKLVAITLIENSAIKKDFNLIASGFGNHAAVLAEQGKFSQAIAILKEHLIYPILSEEPREEADWYYNLATHYTQIGMLDSAIHYFEKCYEIDLKTNNEEGIFHDLRLIATTQLQKGETDNALITLNQAQGILRNSSSYLRELSIVQTLKSRAFQNLGLLDSASFYLSSAIQVSKMTEDRSRINALNLHRVELLIEEGKYDLARNGLMEFENIDQDDENISVRVGRYLACAELNFLEGLSPINCLNSGIALAEKDSLIHYMVRFYTLARDYFKANNQYRKAYKYASKLAKANSSLFESSVESAIVNKQYEMDLIRVEQEKERVSLTNSLLDQRLKSNQRLIYFIISLLILLILAIYFYSRQWRAKRKIQLLESTKALLEKEKEVVHKEMEALRAQMNPHFLFNSLNTVNNAIISKDPRKASQYLTKFAKLMRLILNNSREQLVQLHSEKEVIDLYVTLEKQRYQKDIDLIWEIEEGFSIHQCLIPPMLLQPLVENSIVHGLRTIEYKGVIRIIVQRKSDQLHLIVSDNGIGRKAAMKHKKKSHKSHGLSITNARLELLEKLYGTKASLSTEDLKNESGKSIGTSVCLVIPFINRPE